VSAELTRYVETSTHLNRVTKLFACVTRQVLHMHTYILILHTKWPKTDPNPNPSNQILTLTDTGEGIL